MGYIRDTEEKQGYNGEVGTTYYVKWAELGVKYLLNRCIVFNGALNGITGRPVVE